MFCPQCGAQVEEGSSFCGECGARLQPDDAARPAAGATDAAQPRRKGHIKAIVACAIAALLLAGAGIGVWFVTRPPLQAIDEEAFPDAGVRAAVSAQLDTDGDGKLSEEEMEGAVELTIDEAEEVSGLGAYLPNLADITVGGRRPPSTRPTSRRSSGSTSRARPSSPASTRTAARSSRRSACPPGPRSPRST